MVVNVRATPPAARRKLDKVGRREAVLEEEGDRVRPDRLDLVLQQRLPAHEWSAACEERMWGVKARECEGGVVCAGC